ncbi:hypothetical protein [Anaeroselena agilis]|uniref:Uncharacterized protein n=1 Tax=Anaeroselena agilis TaxID=3063788 RepID=A0ABU3NXS7_9FIRM|nr:hypothetical protein [Selenomonadales bacterium 4137-cl]
MLRSRVALFSALALLLLLPLRAGAATAALTADTELHPVNWATGTVKFKKNTEAVTNEYGEVVSGVLARDTGLRPAGWQRVMFDFTMESGYAPVTSSSSGGGFSFGGGSYSYAVSAEKHLLFKGGQAVTFNEQGEVVAGTLDKPAYIRLVEGKQGYVCYREDTALSFHANGVVAVGTLNFDTWLRPTGWQEILAANGGAGFLKFRKGTVISFSPEGLVTAGTLAAEAKLSAAGGVVKIYPAGTAMRFTAKDEPAP